MPDEPRICLSQNLDRLLKEADGQPLSLEHVLRGVGDQSFGVLLVVLSLPSALPVPAAGYSTPFGIVLAILSVQMIMLRNTPALPGFALKRRIGFETARRFFGAANAFLRRIEWLIHPRMAWIGRPFGRAALGWLTLVMSILMILPIPLTNTFPAMIIFLIGVGLTEDDGLLALAGFVLGALAVLFYAYIIYLALTLGAGAVEQLKEAIKGLFGR